MLMAEAGGDAKFLAGIEQATGVQLGSGKINADGTVALPAYCPGSTCTNGIFNFLAIYSQSSWGRFNDLLNANVAGVEQAPANYDVTSGSKGLDTVAAQMSLLYSIRHSRTNDLPTDWGTYCRGCSDQTNNDPGLAFMSNALQANYTNNAKSVCNIYYVGTGNSSNTARDVVYTVNEATNWANGYCH
jgi:hypothetical protein